jgi:hypothetical protein
LSFGFWVLSARGQPNDSKRKTQNSKLKTQNPLPPAVSTLSN